MARRRRTKESGRCVASPERSADAIAEPEPAAKYDPTGHRHERAECRATIQQGLPDLADDERIVLYLPLAEEQTFAAQIGQELDISTGQAARRLRGAVSHLTSLATRPDRPTVAARPTAPSSTLPG